MKKIIFLIVLSITTFAQSQTEGKTTTISPEETNKLQEEAAASPSNPKTVAPVQTAETPQEVQKTEEPKKNQAKNENQKKSAVPFIKKFYFGGTFGATFGNYTSITVAPTVGYRLRPSVYTGLKVYYTYSSQKIQGEKYDYHNYGFGTFLRWFAFSDLYLHLAPEVFSYEYLTVDNNANVTSRKEWVPYLWAGAGIRKRTSKRSWVSVHVLFDLLNDKNSPYDQWEPNLVIGAGTSF